MPDLELFADPALIRTRTGHERQADARSSPGPDRPERQRVLELGLTDAAFRAKLAAFVAETGLDDPREWTRRIVMDRANWPLSFHRWPLRETTETEAGPASRSANWACPGPVTSPSTPSHPLLQNLAGQPFLVAGRRGRTSFRSASRSQSGPAADPGAGPVHRADRLRGLRPHRRRRLGQAVRDGPERATRSPSGSCARAGLEQGWHFVRVLPQDDEGIALPVEPSDTGPHPANESERFFVVAPADDDDDLDDMLATRTRPRSMPGVTQALRALEFRALGGRPRLAGRPVPLGRLEGPQRART